MEKLNLSPVVWGNSIQFDAALKDEAGAAIDGATVSEAWFTGKKSVSDADGAAVFQVKLSTGGITKAGNVLTVKVADVASAQANKALALACDLKVKFTDGFEAVVARGSLQVLEAVTQSG